MVGPILFAVCVAAFVALLYTAEHFLSTLLSRNRSRDSERLMLETQSETLLRHESD